MKLIRKKFVYKDCDLNTIKNLIEKGEAYPVVDPTIIEIDGEDYPDYKFLWYLLGKNKLDEGVMIERHYTFWERKDEIIEWLKDNYDGLVYPDMIIQFIDKERIKMIEPPIDPPDSYWGYEEEEEDYSLELSKIEKEK